LRKFIDPGVNSHHPMSSRTIGRKEKEGKKKAQSLHIFSPAFPGRRKRGERRKKRESKRYFGNTAERET